MQDLGTPTSFFLNAGDILYIPRGYAASPAPVEGAPGGPYRGPLETPMFGGMDLGFSI